MDTITICFTMIVPGPAWSRDELKIAEWDDINTLDPGWLTHGVRVVAVQTYLTLGKLSPD